jgi:hypothetical protein
MLQVMLNIMYGTGMEVQLGVVQVILNLMYGLGMEVPLGVITGDSEHYVWFRNRGAVGCCYR